MHHELLKVVRRRFFNAIDTDSDGRISQAGTLENDAVLQAKGHSFSATALLGGDTRRAAAFHDGHFITVYLSPRDYHRVHMPCDGRLLETVHVPGRLFSVGPSAPDSSI